MRESNWIELCAFMSSLWGRELTKEQKAAGLKLLGGLPDEAVEDAVVKIAESGADRLPPWPVVFKAAQSIADAMRDRMPALPAGDSLSDEEHAAAMIRLRARQTPEQRRRADRVTGETRMLPMPRRLVLASGLLALNDRVDPAGWDALFEAVLSGELAKLTPTKVVDR